MNDKMEHTIEEAILDPLRALSQLNADPNVSLDRETTFRANRHAQRSIELALETSMEIQLVVGKALGHLQSMELSGQGNERQWQQEDQ